MRGALFGRVVPVTCRYNLRQSAFGSCYLSTKSPVSRKCAPISLVRGTHDVYPSEGLQRALLFNYFKALANIRGFEELSTPIFEYTSVFQRSLGEMSDIVHKEMYTFSSSPQNDAGGESMEPMTLTLRPEGTAGLMRSVISSGNIRLNDQKYFYYGPMFRHERPQKGRYRQFTQIGIEHIGTHNRKKGTVDGNTDILGWSSDVDAIEFADRFLRGILPVDNNKDSPYRLRLLVNTLGDRTDTYETVLKEYLLSNLSKLSADSRLRVEKGAYLRVLDSKHPLDQEIIKSAPVLYDHLSSASKLRFQRVLKGISDRKIDYEISHTLVRGLDYYCHTIFEFIVEPVEDGDPSSDGTSKSLVRKGVGHLGTVLAGGRYDSLSTALGYQGDVPCIGWAAGMERLLLLTHLDARKLVPRPFHIAVVPILAVGSGAHKANSALEIGASSVIAEDPNSGIVVENELHESFAMQSMKEKIVSTAETLAYFLREDVSSGKLVSTSQESSSQVQARELGGHRYPFVLKKAIELTTSPINIRVSVHPGGTNMKKILPSLLESNVDVAVLIGEQEIHESQVQVRDLQARRQYPASIHNMLDVTSSSNVAPRFQESSPSSVVDVIQTILRSDENE